jgi:hypothetical protein
MNIHEESLNEAQPLSRLWPSRGHEQAWVKAQIGTKLVFAPKSVQKLVWVLIIFVCNFSVPYCSFHPLSGLNWAFWSPLWWTLLDYFVGCKTFASRKPSINSLTQRKCKKTLKLLSQSHHTVNKIQTPDHWDYTYKQCQSLSCHTLYSPPLGTANLATNSKALVTQDSQQLHQYKEEHKSLQYYDHIR